MAIILNNSFFRVSDGVFRSVEPVFSSGGVVLSYTVTELLTTTGAGTWTKPTGITSITVECWGGGGAGGGASQNTSAAAGGAGGQYAKKTITYSSAQQSISYLVGAGGTAGAGLGGDGVSTTWETNVVVAVGGSGGEAAAVSGVTSNGGVGSTVGGIGDVVYAGGSGGGGYYFGLSGNYISGAGGGGAGSTGPGGSASLNTAGTGTPELGGNGAAGINNITPVAGTAGSIYGGGGSGASKSSGANINGGAGARGVVRVSYQSNPPLQAYTGSNAAYSIRQLSTSATASMRVRRSSDSTELDIGFQPNGMLDTGSLTTFVGSSTGYVAKWYDQTGGGYHMTPFSGVVTTWAAIVKSGTLQTENGKPAIRFDGGQAYISQLTTQQYTTAGGLWFQFGVLKVDDATVRVLTKIGNSVTIAQSIRRGTTAMEAIGYNTAAGTGTDNNGVSPGTAQVVTYTQRTSTGIEIYMNGASNGATTVAGTPQTEAAPSVMVVGAFNPSTLANAWLGSVQEIIHYPQSSVTFDYRIGLTAEIRSYYGTF